MARRGGFKRGGGSKRKRTAPHNIADDFERERHEKDLAKHMKNLNEDGTPKKLLTKSGLLSIIRGAIREHCWMYSPNKLAFENMATVPDDDPSSRRRWKRQCESCGEWFKQTDIQTDHKVGEHSLKDWDQVWDFYLSINNVGFSEMSSLCVPCHDLKTAMERYGYTEEQAKIFKNVNLWLSHNKGAKVQKDLLKSYGYSDTQTSNGEKRKECLWDYFSKLEG